MSKLRTVSFLGVMRAIKVMVNIVVLLLRERSLAAYLPFLGIEFTH